MDNEENRDGINLETPILLVQAEEKQETMSLNLLSLSLNEWNHLTVDSISLLPEMIKKIPGCRWKKYLQSDDEAKIGFSFVYNLGGLDRWATNDHVWTQRMGVAWESCKIMYKWNSIQSNGSE